MWIYKQTEPGLFTVGFYAPDGSWNTDSDHGSREEAANRAAFLNGNQAAGKKYYLIVVHDDVEPTVMAGPFTNYDGVLEAARKHRKSEDGEFNDGIYSLEITNGTPEVSSFAGCELDDDD